MHADLTYGRSARFASLLIAGGMMLGAGCAGGGRAPDPGATVADCGLPTPKDKVDPSMVPALFVDVVDGEVVQAQQQDRGFVAAINLRLSVTEAFKRYRTAVKEAGYQEITVDNEGFEAEITLKKGKAIVAIQIRRSICEDASVAFVNQVHR
ncbi:MAG: hypothetical protein M3345_00715 [Actinomycetota bacterium]|nr:hypothetical protein [Actinomycetota bacterium]